MKRFSLTKPSWIARRSTVLLCVTLFGGAFFVLAHAGLARVMSQEQYGLLVYALGAVEFIISFALMGMPTLLTRETAANRSTGSAASAAARARFARKVVFLFSIPVCAITIGYLELTADGAETYGAVALVSVAVYLVALAQLDCDQGLLRGLRRPVEASMPNQLVRPAVLMGLTGILYLQATGSNQTGLAAMACAMSVTWLVTNLLARRRVQMLETGVEEPAESKVRVGAWLRSGTKMTMASLARNMQHRALLLMLGAMASASEVALFAVALQLGRVILLALSSVSNVASPLMAEAVRNGDGEALQSAYSQSVRWVAVVALAVSLVIGFGGKIILGLYGPAYVGAYHVLLIVLASRLVASLAGPTAAIMNMGGGEGALMNILWFGGIVAVALALFLIPDQGASGAAWAMFAGVTVSNVCILIYIRIRHGLSLTRALLGR